MRIALIQADPTVGDLDANARWIGDALARAAAEGADIAVTPEMAICGYPARDLLSRADFTARCMAAARATVERSPLPVVLGTPWHEGGESRPSNAAVIGWGGAVRAVHRKVHLPDYDVFDESRHFAAGAGVTVVDVPARGGATVRVGILVCEDLWRARDGVRRPAPGSRDLVAESVASGAQLIAALSASPFEVGKDARRDALLSAAARSHRVTVASVNQAGADDDLVFDGGSTLWSADGACLARCSRFAPQALVADAQAPSGSPGAGSGAWDPPRERAHAIVASIAGYFRKTGHARAIVGLSGGIDSAVVAALAVAALGKGHVQGVSMPGPWSSEGSVTDAEASARMLGMAPPLHVPISEPHATVARTLAGATGRAPEGTADENLQSRLRGVALMTLSNASGALVLTTGNKSECAVGYATLYGDMCGALAPIGDVLKTDVYALANWLNAHGGELGLPTPCIPQASIDKAPSAELRPNQTDQDSLPPYADLDRIIEGWVERELPAADIARIHGLDAALVMRWCRAIDLAQHKRAQAAVVTRLSPRAFGPGRRQPIAMRWSPA